VDGVVIVTWSTDVGENEGSMLDGLAVELVIAAMLEDSTAENEDGATEVDSNSRVETKPEDDMLELVWLLVGMEENGTLLEETTLGSAKLDSVMAELMELLMENVDKETSLEEAILDANELDTAGVGPAKLLTEAGDDWLLLDSDAGVDVAIEELMELTSLDMGSGVSL
jgi:hypothetical protein